MSSKPWNPTGWRHWADPTNELDRLAIDVINGGSVLREWVDDSEAVPDDLDRVASADEAAWRESIAAHLAYN